MATRTVETGSELEQKLDALSVLGGAVLSALIQVHSNLAHLTGRKDWREGLLLLGYELAEVARMVLHICESGLDPTSTTGAGQFPTER